MTSLTNKVIMDKLDRIVALLEQLDAKQPVRSYDELLGDVFARAEKELELMQNDDFEFDLEMAITDLSRALRNIVSNSGDNTVTVRDFVAINTPGSFASDLVRYSVLSRKKGQTPEDKKQRAEILKTALERAGLWG